MITFCVCAFAQTGSTPSGDHAHPINFRPYGSPQSWGGVLSFTYTWESSTGDLSDLDQVQIGEYVTYDDGGKHVGSGRPWTANNPNPTQMWWPGTKGFLTDGHSSPGATAGPSDSFVGTQHYGYYCQKCGATVNIHGFHADLMGPLTITKSVELDQFGDWEFRVVKSGAVATDPLP